MLIFGQKLKKKIIPIENLPFCKLNPYECLKIESSSNLEVNQALCDTRKNILMNNLGKDNTCVFVDLLVALNEHINIKQRHWTNRVSRFTMTMHIRHSLKKLKFASLFERISRTLYSSDLAPREISLYIVFVNFVKEVKCLNVFILTSPYISFKRWLVTWCVH